MAIERVEAARVRAAATRIYSRAWDEPARRGLTALLQRNKRSVVGAIPSWTRGDPGRAPRRDL